MTSYPYLMSSVKASAPTPVAPVAVAVRTATLALVFGPRPDGLDGPVENRREEGRWNLACLRSWVRQLVHVQGVLLARRDKGARESDFILAAKDGTLGGRVLACEIRPLRASGSEATPNWQRHSCVVVIDVRRYRERGLLCMGWEYIESGSRCGVVEDGIESVEFDDRGTF